MAVISRSWSCAVSYELIRLPISYSEAFTEPRELPKRKHDVANPGPAILAVLKGSQSQFRSCLIVWKQL